MSYSFELYKLVSFAMMPFNLKTLKNSIVIVIY
jgi:hypothetical protein